MKILISINYLKDIGGIGTSAINLINEIHNLYDVTLCVTSNFISSKYNIPQNVKIIKGSEYLRDVVVDRKYLTSQNTIQKFKRNILRIFNHYLFKTRGIEWALHNIKVEGNYDIAIAFSDYKYCISECKSYDYFNVLNNVSAKRKIAWIHNDPRKIGWTHDLVIKRLSSFDKIVNVSYECKKIFDEIAPELKSKSEVVYNMYDLEGIKQKADINEKKYHNNGKLHIVTVARIQVVQKRIDRIIECCRRLIKEDNITTFDWTLVGDGSDINLFKSQVNELGLQDNIHFVGLQTNPYPYMKQADLFVLSSDYEGFGMTIKEAQILNTPTITTNFGPAKENIIVGFQGEISPNSTDGLYSILKEIILNPYKLDIYNEYLLKNPIDNNIALSQFHNVCTK